MGNSWFFTVLWKWLLFSVVFSVQIPTLRKQLWRIPGFISEFHENTEITGFDVKPLGRKPVHFWTKPWINDCFRHFCTRPWGFCRVFCCTLCHFPLHTQLRAVLSKMLICRTPRHRIWLFCLKLEINPGIYPSTRVLTGFCIRTETGKSRILLISGFW